jgi:hypothetical protein
MCENIEHDPKKLPGAWTRGAKESIDDLWDFLEDGEEEILERRRKRERARDDQEDREEEEREREEGRGRGRSRLVDGAANGDLSRDPATVPGAIRLVLSEHPQGLKLPELATAIEKLKPDTPTASISSALSPMVKRREIVREGFHKSYRYILVVPKDANGAAKEADVSE